MKGYPWPLVKMIDEIYIRFVPFKYIFSNKSSTLFQLCFQNGYQGWIQKKVTNPT